MKITYAEGVQPTKKEPVEKEGASEETKSGMAAALERLRKQQKLVPMGRRQVRRIQQRDADRHAKKATRNWRRSKMDALQDESTVLGLARVHLLGVGTPAMRENVKVHVRDLEETIAAQQDMHLVDAQVALRERFEQVLAAHGETVP